MPLQPYYVYVLLHVDRLVFARQARGRSGPAGMQVKYTNFNKEYFLAIHYIVNGCLHNVTPYSLPYSHFRRRHLT